MHVKFEQADIEKVWVAEANLAGPTVAIFGGVHGDELSGIEAVTRTVESGIDIEAGRIILALGNLAAIKLNVRHTGVNLNRVFRDLTTEELERFDQLPYEFRRAQALNRFLDESDALLDLHDFSDPNGPIFMITEPRGFDVARAIGAPVISSGWSTAEFGGSDSRMETQDKIGICYEIGDKTKPAQNIARAIGARDRFLEQMGLCEEVSNPMFEDPRYIHNDYAVLRQPGEFSISKPYRTFDELAEGECIAINGGEPVYARAGQVIIFPAKDAPPIGEEAFSIGHLFAA